MSENGNNGNGVNGELVEKFNGGTREQISGLVQEYVGLHQIVDSSDPTKRTNFVNRREDALGNIRQGLEGIISSAMGNIIYPNKEAVDKIIEGLVVEGYKADGMELPEDPKKRQEAISKYLANAGIDYTQLVKQTINTRRPTKFAELPDDHPLKVLANYIAAQSNEEQRRLLFIQQRLVSLGDVHSPAIAEAFNQYGGLRLDPRVAKPQEAFRTYAELVTARRQAYETNAPDKVHNAMEKAA